MTDASRPSAVMSWQETAHYAFQRSESWLRRHMPADFPRPDPLSRTFYRASVDQWLARRNGLDSKAPRSKDSVLMARLGKHGQDHRALSG